MRAWMLAFVVGCAGADARALQAPTPTGVTEPVASLGLHAGETMAFEVRLAGVLAGEAQLAVGDVGEVGGRKAIVVRSRAATAGAAALLKQLSDESTTVVDVDTGRPITIDAIVENNGKRLTANTRFLKDRAMITYQRSTDNAPKTMAVQFVQLGDTSLFDAHTAMAQLRGWKPSPGARRTVYVIGGRRLWRIDLTYKGEETVGSALGNRRAIVFAGEAFRSGADLKSQSSRPNRTFTVWLSDDADRVPLKVTASTELGDVVMDLTDYQRP